MGHAPIKTGETTQGGRARSRIIPVLRLERVTCRRGDRLVLDEVSLTVAPGELVVVHGGRGAGKTTLLAVAAGARGADEGSVLVGDRDLAGLQRGSLPFVRRNVAYLPPDPPFVADETALENVMLALAVRGENLDAAEAAAFEALAVVGMSDVADAEIRSLSAGELRLVALARAIVGRPAAIVLDEPAASLSTADRRLAAAAIAAARDAGAAVLCATAEEAFVEVLAASDGRRVRLDNARLHGATASISLVREPRDLREPLWTPAEIGAPERRDDFESDERPVRLTAV